MRSAIAAIGLAAVIALSPVAAFAETTQTASHHAAHKPTGSHRSEMRKRHNSSKERARASAEHMRQMRQQ